MSAAAKAITPEIVREHGLSDAEYDRILGLMPHPECVVDPLLGPPDGLPLFQSLVEALS